MACQRKMIIDPDKKSGIFELVLHRHVEIGKRHDDFGRLAATVAQDWRRVVRVSRPCLTPPLMSQVMSWRCGGCPRVAKHRLPMLNSAVSADTRSGRTRGCVGRGQLPVLEKSPITSTGSRR